MKNISQDIYGTDRKDQKQEPLSEPDRLDLLNKPWTDAMRARRLYSAVLTTIVLTISALVATVVVQQYLLITRRSPPKSARTSTNMGSPSPLDFSADPQTQFLTDELAEMKATAIPEKGDMPLSGPWVKETAYYLIQAEKAVKEERFDDALQAYEKVILINPNIQGVRRQMGLLCLRQKQYPKAAEMFEKVATEEEMTFGLANNLGVSYLAAEDYPKAEQNFLEAVKLNPAYALAYFNLATLYLRKNDATTAATYFEKYLNLKPDDVTAAQTYAMILVELKQWDKAVVSLEQIGRIAPDVAPIHFRLAEALAHTQKHDAAMLALRRGAGLVDAKRALAWLSRPEFDLLRNDPAFRQLLSELEGGN